MKRIRGRRVALLLASALPLLAEDDVFSKNDVETMVTPPPPRVNEESFVQQQQQPEWNAVEGQDNNEDDTNQEFTATTAERSAESVSSNVDDDNENDDSDRIVVEEESSSLSAAAAAAQHHDDDSKIQQRENDDDASIPTEHDDENEVEVNNDDSSEAPPDDVDSGQRPFRYPSLKKVSPRPEHMFDHVVIPLRPYEYFYDTVDDDEPWKRSADGVLNKSNATTTTTTASSDRSESTAAVNATDTTETSVTEAAVDDSSSSSSRTSEPEVTKESLQAEEQQERKPAVEQAEQPRVVVDYASKSAGALVLEKSANFQGTSNLLTANRDQYAIVECHEEQKFVVIGLPEDILVKQVVLANYERYSSHVKDFKIQGSTTMGEWIDLGTYTAQKPGASKNGKQVFDLKEPSWARYLKFQFLTYYGNEHYCTISQISVHGSTMLQGFHEQWSEEESVENKANQEAIEKRKEQDVSSEDSGVEEVEGAGTRVEEIPKGIETRKSLVPFSRGLTTLVDVCSIQGDFQERLSFEKSMAQSPAHNTDTIASFSVGLSARNPSALSQNETTPRYRELSQNGFSRSPRQKSENANRMVANAFTSRNSSFLSLTDSPVVKKIRGLIKSATGLDVSLDKIGHIFLVGPNEMRVDMSADAGAAAKNESLTKPPEDVSQDKESHVVDAEERMEGTPSKVSTSREKPDIETRGHLSSGATKEATAKAAIHETDLSLAKALERLPNAGCLKDLDFAAFKTKHLNVRTGASGSSSGAPAGHAMEPIFKKLTDEIKALQANVGVHDMYAAESIMCYQRVILDLMVEMETLRSKQDERISLLEKRSDWTGSFVGWAREGGELILSTYHSIEPKFVAAVKVIVALVISLTAEDSDIPIYALAFVALLTCCICYFFVSRVTRALFCTSKRSRHVDVNTKEAPRTPPGQPTPPLIDLSS